MAVQIVSSETISGDTFYRNRAFDISFSVSGVVGIDTSLSFSNSTGTPTYGVLSYVSNGHFKSTSGVSTVGPLGTLSVDVLTTTPTVVSTVTPQTYVSANAGCTDPAGNVYFAVANQNKVFQLDPSGVVTTFAGTGIAGDSDGSRFVAQFRAPSSIATDGSGTFFVTDQYRVRKIDSNGVVSTLAGSATRGMADGVGSNASFFSASTVVIRPNGDLLVSDDDSHCIRSVTQAGVVTTYAGLADSPGFQDGQLRPDSNVTTFQGTQAWPFNTTFFSGYETSSGGNEWDVTPFPASPPMAFIQAAIDASTEILFVGSMSYFGVPFVFVAKSGGTARGPVSFPSNALTTAYGVATDGAGTYVLGGSYGAVDLQVLRSVDNGSNWVTTGPFLAQCRAVAYGGGTWMAAGDPPAASTSNLIYSTDASTWTATGACPISNIYGLAYGGGRWVAVGTGGSTVAYSDNNGVSWTGSTPIAARGNKIAYNAGVWVAGFEEYTSNALYFSTDGATFTETDSGSTGQVTAVYYSAFESRWFASVGTTTILSFDGSQWFTLASPEEVSINAYIDVSYSLTTYSNNGARFYFPHGLLYDPSENLYIADQYNNRIRRIAAGSSNVTTYAGTGAATISNGTLTTAGMARPSSLARNSTGTIYVGSFERNTLQTIIGSNVTLLAGANFSPGYVDGVSDVARFNGLGGLTVDRNNDLYISEIYNGDIRKLVTYPEVRPDVYHPPGYTIIATSNYPIVINSRIDVSWSSVGGSLPLYKYEPFCNTFTARGTGNTLAYTATSSTELLGYLSGAGTSNVLFRGPNGASVAYPYSLTLSVQALSNGIVYDDVSTSVTINAARIITTPCNSSLVFYRNEPSPNPVFSLESSPVQLIYSASTLPAGLSFVKTASNAFTLTGTPTIQSITSNYTILGQDTSGRTYSTQVTMLVNPERLILDVSGSLTLSNLSSNTPMSPITFTSRFPPYTNPDRAVTYSWFPAPPAGLQFKLKGGTAVSGLSQSIAFSADPSFELTLSGTITSEQLLSYASNGVTSASIVFNGVRTNGGGLLSPAIPKTITISSFAEFIDFSWNVVPLYVGRPVSDTYYFARTYFPITDSSIDSIEIIDGFIPDGLDASFTVATQRFSFTGTPTSAGSYGFTLQARNGQGRTATLPVTLTPSNDSVFITTTADSCFNFIQYRPLTSEKIGFYTDPIRYTATAASGSSVTVVGANLPAGVTLVSISNGLYELQGVPTAASTLTTATLTGTAQGTGAIGLKTFLYSVSAEVFTFNDLSLAFIQNVPITPAIVTATTKSEQPILRYSAPALPPALQIANTGKLTGTPLGDTSGTFAVTAYTPYSSGTKTYSYSMTPDQVLLQPSVAQMTTAPGCNVSIPITGYSLSATTVSNFRFEDPFAYGLTVNPTTGLLSGAITVPIPATVDFTVLGNAGTAVGSLNGQILTYDQSFIRNNVLGIENQSNLRVYEYREDGSMLVTIVSSNNLVAARIGINDAGVYLIPTSSDSVLRSITTELYTSIPLGQSARSPLMTGIVYDAASSTWWIGGTLLDTTRSVYVFKSTDDGLTWDAGTLIPGLQDRSGNISPGSGVYSAYLYGGVDLASRDGILLVGGKQIARSSTGGTAWTTSTSSLIEVGRFSLEQGTVWLAVGSSLYSSLNDNTYTADATTIVYSLDQGETWSDAPGGFNMNAYDIVYGNGVWLAYGLDRSGSEFLARIRYSFDGLTWAILTSIPSRTYGTTIAAFVIGGVGAITYTGSEWRVISPDLTYADRAIVYTHPADTPIDAGWSTSILFSVPGNVAERLVSYSSQTVDPGPDISIIRFPTGANPPTFISPAQSTYVAWQYMPLPPITFAATGTYPISYFVSSLPVGLTWDPVTRTITGAAVQIGTQTFTVYALEDKPGDDAVTAFTVTLIVEVPRIVKQQTGAGAYTSLVRQYTTVNAAQNARDTRAFPTQVRGIGEFASPYPPDVITPSNCPC